MEAVKYNQNSIYRQRWCFQYGDYRYLGVATSSYIYQFPVLGL